jgi:hypothetical protein
MIFVSIPKKKVGMQERCERRTDVCLTKVNNQQSQVVGKDLDESLYDQSNHAWKSDIYIVRKEACLPGNNQTLLESTYTNLIKWNFLFEK